MIKKYKGYDYIVYLREVEIIRHFNAYVRLPENHPLFNRVKRLRWMDFGLTFSKVQKTPKPKSRRRYHYDYDAAQEIDVHGGFTFADWITTKNVKDYKQGFTLGLWLGWDYTHLGDCSYNHDSKEFLKLQEEYQKKELFQCNKFGIEKHWTEPEVEEDCRNCIDELIKYAHPKR